jgi:hypothetical protein
MLRTLHNTYNHTLHGPNQIGVGRYQVWREILFEITFTINRTPSTTQEGADLCSIDGSMTPKSCFCGFASYQPCCVCGLYQLKVVASVHYLSLKPLMNWFASSWSTWTHILVSAWTKPAFCNLRARSHIHVLLPVTSRMDTQYRL